MMKEKNVLAENLAVKAIHMAGSRSNEIERFCWMAVHEHRHGVIPSEYDIRDIDEGLYLDVLSCAKRKA